MAELNLHQKILKIANIAGVLQRTKEGYGYKYVPEEDIQAKVTAGMQKYGLMLYESIVPGSLRWETRDYLKGKDSKGNEKWARDVIVAADTVYTWVNVDNPEERLEVPWVIIGQMEDAAQAFGAGTTYCNRYFLMKSLQLATTEADPDNYRSKQLDAENTEEKIKADREAKELAEAIAKVTEKGNALLAAGIDKKDLTTTIAGVNGGNGNPKSIKSVEIATKALKALDGIKKETKKNAE